MAGPSDAAQSVSHNRSIGRRCCVGVSVGRRVGVDVRVKKASFLTAVRSCRGVDGYQCIEFLGSDTAVMAYHARDGLHVARIAVPCSTSSRPGNNLWSGSVDRAAPAHREHLRILAPASTECEAIDGRLERLTRGVDCVAATWSALDSLRTRMSGPGGSKGCLDSQKRRRTVGAPQGVRSPRAALLVVRRANVLPVRCWSVRWPLVASGLFPSEREHAAIGRDNREVRSAAHWTQCNTDTHEEFNNKSRRLFRT